MSTYYQAKLFVGARIQSDWRSPDGQNAFDLETDGIMSEYFGTKLLIGQEIKSTESLCSVDPLVIAKAMEEMTIKLAPLNLIPSLHLALDSY